MADDITISGQNQNDQSGDSNDSDRLNPVIDLRSADQQAPNSGAPAGSQPAQAAQAGTSANQTSAATSARRTNAILLEEDEETPQGPPAEKYAVPSIVKEKFPDLIQLIKETESMNDEERDYWFQILPIMTEDQIKKFRDILVNEKQQLSHLDDEYEQELNKMNEKHLIEWKEFETREKRKTLTTAEQAAEENEKADEEALLKRLNNI